MYRLYSDIQLWMLPKQHALPVYFADLTEQIIASGYLLTLVSTKQEQSKA